MLAQELIRIKRDGGVLDAAQIGALAADEAAALQRVDAVLADGLALERFARRVTALGGPADFCEDPERQLAAAPVQCAVPALKAGWVVAKATRDIALAVIELGGGRRGAADTIDHRVGFGDMATVGQRIESGDRLATVHAADERGAAAAVHHLQQCIRIGESTPALAPVLIARVAEPSTRTHP